jgi:hypothetical protein
VCVDHAMDKMVELRVCMPMYVYVCVCECANRGEDRSNVLEQLQLFAVWERTGQRPYAIYSQPIVAEPAPIHRQTDRERERERERKKGREKGRETERGETGSESHRGTNTWACTGQLGAYTVASASARRKCTHTDQCRRVCGCMRVCMPLSVRVCACLYVAGYRWTGRAMRYLSLAREGHKASTVVSARTPPGPSLLPSSLAYAHRRERETIRVRVSECV